MASHSGLMATSPPVTGRGNGAPQWIVERAFEISPDAKDQTLSRSNGDSLMAAAQAEVSQWLDGSVEVPRNIDFVEICCGTGGITDAVADLEMKSRGLD
eukprot:8798623-Pyramimonas_sp.AAC.1